MTKTILISTIIALTAVGITSAYAINLDLKADTTVTGDLDVTGTISGFGTVPIGTVLDWWCPLGCTIPDGFVMADGQLISDAASPFDGENVPDLTNTFVKGVTPTNLDTTGGTSTHSHSHDHANAVSSSAGAAHTHSHNHANQGTSDNNGDHVHGAGTLSISTEGHNHRWGNIDISERANTFDTTGSLIVMQDWFDGIGSEGENFFPFALNCFENNCVPTNFYTDNRLHSHDISSITATQSAPHGHSVNLPNQVSSAGNANHEHNTNLPNIQSSTENNEPPWHGLVKIIRIK